MASDEAPPRNAPERPDPRTDLEKRVIALLEEHGILTTPGLIITPQQALRYIKAKHYAYYTDAGARIGESGGTFQITNLRWSCRTLDEGVALRLEIDSMDFSELEPVTRPKGHWKAYYRDRAHTPESCLVRIKPD